MFGETDREKVTALLREASKTTLPSLIHSGRTTQVWDVEVSAQATDKTLTLFRATQMILYPQP